MAVFEQERLRTLAGAAREWRGSRFLPLYAAGIIAGVGIGVGLTFVFDGQSQAAAPVVTQPPAAAALTFGDAPTMPFGWERGPLQIPDEVDVVIPLPDAVPAATETAPIAPAVVDAPAAPVAQQPAASAPAAAPQSQPIEAPAPPPPAPEPVSNFYVPSSVGGNAAAESRLLAGINAERAAAGLPAYVLDSGLTNIARIRSQQLIDQGYFAHIDPYGYKMYAELLRYFGYSFNWAGENLAMNNHGMDVSPEVALDGLMNSPTHRANVLAPDFYRIGVGEVTAPDGRNFYTMVFVG